MNTRPPVVEVAVAMCEHGPNQTGEHTVVLNFIWLAGRRFTHKWERVASSNGREGKQSEMMGHEIPPFGLERDESSIKYSCFLRFIFFYFCFVWVLYFFQMDRRISFLTSLLHVRQIIEQIYLMHKLNKKKSLARAHHFRWSHCMCAE